MYANLNKYQTENCPALPEWNLIRSEVLHEIIEWNLSQLDVFNFISETESI